MLSFLQLCFSALSSFLSSWILIPAPMFALLPLAVGAPEISPFLFLANAIALLFALKKSRRRKLQRVAIGLSLVGLVLSSLPLLQLPGTLAQSNQMMQTILGTDYPSQIPSAVQATMQPQSIGLVTMMTRLITGVSSSNRSANLRHDRLPLTLKGTTFNIELYRPSTAGQYPAIVTIYGGAWQRGDASQNATFNRYMAAQGYTVIAIDYRHAPRFQFPAQLQDVQAQLEFLVQNASSYDFDPTRMAIMGWSAGGHLAVMTAYQSSIPLRAVVSYYGPTNLLEGYTNPPHPDPIDTRDVLEKFIGGTPDQFADRYQAASPVNAVRSNLPPTLLIYGDRDHIVKPIFGQQLFDRLTATGNQAALIRLPWAEHAFDAIFRGIGNQIALYHTERFLYYLLQQ